MKTKTIEVFEFKELDEKTQKKVLEKLAYCNVDFDDWYQHTIEELQSDLADKGFDNAKISFSGFSNQGDGASFDADINLAKFCQDKRILAIAQSYCDFRIDKNSYANHYSHERTRYVEYNGLDTRYVNIGMALQKLSDAIEKERLSLCREIYKDLSDEYDDLTSDAQIIETIEANEWTFRKDGKMENI